MIKVSLDSGGMERALKDFRRHLDRNLKEGLEATLESIAATAKGTTTFTDRTGALRNSIESEGVEGNAEEMVGTVGFGATSTPGLRKKRGGKRRRQTGGYFYGLAQEYGTKTGIKEKRFIRDAIDAEFGGFLEDALANAFRDAGMDVT